jgi:hypothetical protein
MSGAGQRRSVRVFVVAAVALPIIVAAGLALAYVRREWDPPKGAFFVIVALSAAAVGAATVRLSLPLEWLEAEGRRRRAAVGRPGSEPPGAETLAAHLTEAEAHLTRLRAEVLATVQELEDKREVLESVTEELARRQGEAERARAAERRARRRA